MKTKYYLNRLHIGFLLILLLLMAIGGYGILKDQYEIVRQSGFRPLYVFQKFKIILWSIIGLIGIPVGIGGFIIILNRIFLHKGPFLQIEDDYFTVNNRKVYYDDIQSIELIDHYKKSFFPFIFTYKVYESINFKLKKEENIKSTTHEYYSNRIMKLIPKKWHTPYEVKIPCFVLKKCKKDDLLNTILKKINQDITVSRKEMYIPPKK